MREEGRDEAQARLLVALQRLEIVSHQRYNHEKNMIPFSLSLRTVLVPDSSLCILSTLHTSALPFHRKFLWHRYHPSRLRYLLPGPFFTTDPQHRLVP